MLGAVGVMMSAGMDCLSSALSFISFSATSTGDSIRICKQILHVRLEFVDLPLPSSPRISISSSSSSG